MASNANEAIQQLELLLQSGETIDSDNFIAKVGEALNGRLGGYYQLYLFTILLAHTTPEIPRSPFPNFALLFRDEASSLLHHTQKSLPYRTENIRFTVPQRREAIEYMLDILHNIEHLTKLFPPEESINEKITRKALDLLYENNHLIGMEGEPRVVLTLFRIFLAAELLERYLPANNSQDDILKNAIVRWWWEEGEFPEHFPGFDNRLTTETNGYPGVFGKLLLRLGSTQPEENPRLWEDPRQIFPHLPRQSQTHTQPWVSNARELPTTSTDNYRGSFAVGEFGRLTSQRLSTIVEEPQVPTEQNQQRPTNTYCLPDVSATSRSSEGGEDDKTAPSEKETSVVSQPRSMNIFSVPGKNIESSDSSDFADHNTPSPTASTVRETSTSAVEQTATTESNINLAIGESSVSHDKDSTAPSSPHAIQNTSDEPDNSPVNDTIAARTNDSGGSFSPSRQLHEFLQNLPADIPSNSLGPSPRPSPPATSGNEQGTEGVSSLSRVLRADFRRAEERPVTIQSPQVTSAAAKPDESPEKLPAIPPQGSSPPPPRRSERQRQQPERYSSAPTQRRKVINSDPENVGHAKGKTKKSTNTDKNKRQRNNKRKSTDLEREPTKRQKRFVRGQKARRKKSTSPPPAKASVSAPETVSVSARGRVRKVPQKYGP